MSTMTPESAATERGLSYHTAPAATSDAALAGVRPVNPTRVPDSTRFRAIGRPHRFRAR